MSRFRTLAARRVSPVRPALTHLTRGDDLEGRILLAAADAMDDAVGPFSDDAATEFPLADLLDNDTPDAATFSDFTQPSGGGTLSYDVASETFTFTPDGTPTADVTFTYTIACPQVSGPAVLEAGTAVAGGGFGNAIASDGSIGVIASAGEDAVYFGTVDADGGFTPTTRLVADDRTGDAADEFGAAVAVGDGMIFVGDPAAGGGAGRVVVFTDDGTGAFSQSGVLTAGDAAAGARFGASLAYDNGTLAVGSPQEAGGTANTGGAVYLFADDSGTLTQAQKIEDPLGGDPDEGDSSTFGYAVALDGDRLAVSAVDGSADATLNGVVFVYDRPSGGAFALSQTVESGVTDESFIRFGESLSLQGDRLAVGAPQATAPSGLGTVVSGTVGVFDRQGDGRYTRTALLEPAQPLNGQEFGTSVSLDDGVVAVGSAGTGQVAVFQAMDDVFGEIDSTQSDLSGVGAFGSAVLVLGNRVYAGAPEAEGDDGSPVAEAGAAVRYELARDLADVSDTATVTFSTEEVNDAPTVDDENVFLPADVMTGDSVTTVVSGDPDGDTLSFAITAGNESGAFRIDGATGEITVADAALLPSVSTLTVTAADDADPMLSGSGTVTVTVANRPPALEDQTFTVPADAAFEDVVADLEATDPDEGDALTYSIIDGNEAGAYAINGATGEITVADELSIPASATLTVLVVDDGEPDTRSDTALITLTRDDANNPPALEDEAVTVPDTLAAGDTVIDLEATDADGDALTYAITAGDDGGVFTIDAGSGEITVADPSGLEEGVFALTVSVTDDGDPAESDTATVTVTVTDENNPPVLEDVTVSVPSDAEAGDLVVDLDATDRDAGDSLMYQITAGNGSGAFMIDAASGVISVFNASAVPETAVLEVTVFDNGDPSASDTADVTINRVDPNTPPVLEDQTVEVPRNATAGDAVVDLDATDADGDGLTYAITAGNEAGAFTIDPDTGVISVLDETAVPETATLTVTVVDDGDPPESDTAEITINRAPNTAPVLEDAAAEVPRNAADGDTLIDLDAADAEGDALTYAITAGNEAGAYDIDPATGVVTVADASLVPETATLTVTVTDDGDPALSDTAEVVLTQQAPNNPPVLEDVTAVVPADAADGDAVIDLDATDADGDDLEYSIVSGNDAGAFEIDAATGLITVADAAAIEDTQQLTVQVTDNQDTDGVDTAVVTINREGAFVPAAEAVLALAEGGDVILADFDEGRPGGSRVVGALPADRTYSETFTGDFDGDGRTDVAAVDADTGEVVVGLFDGEALTTSVFGTFDPSADYSDFVAGDFDGDGVEDVAARSLADGFWTVGFSDGSGLDPDTRWARWTTARDWLGVIVGDFNGDGRDDISGRVDAPDPAGNGGGIYVSFSDGDFVRTRIQSAWSKSRPWTDEAAVDVNGDGRDDIVGRTADTNAFYAALGAEDLTVKRAMRIGYRGRLAAGRELADVVYGDFDGDGSADVAARIADSSAVWTGLSADSRFDFTRAGTLSSRTPYSDLAVGDFNDDGRDDLLARNLDTNAFVRLQAAEGGGLARVGGDAGEDDLIGDDVDVLDLFVAQPGALAAIEE